jgi:hypothetical protein
MKPRNLIYSLLAVGLLSCSPLARLNAAPMGTAFTYSGKLAQGGQAATGLYDMAFRLHSALSGGSAASAELEIGAIPVTNGLFMATLDFGSAPFDGSARHLEIRVRPSGVAGVYTTLAPRQPLTPAPYALHAPSAGTAVSASTVPWAGLSGVPAGLADNIDNDTTYTPGAGMTLAGGQFSVTFSGTGSATTAARSDHDHTGAYVRKTGDTVTGSLDVFGPIKTPSLTNSGILNLSAGSDIELVLDRGGSALSYFEIFKHTNSFAVFSVSEDGIVSASSFVGSGAGLTGIGGSALANNSIDSAKIADATVGTSDLAANAVTTAKLADNSVTSAKLAAGAVSSLVLADNSVLGAKILDGSVGTADLADNSVTSAKLADGAVSTAKLVNSAVTTEKIADGSVSLADLNTANVDGRYVLKAGDSITGSLAVAGPIRTPALTNAGILNLAAGSDIELILDRGGSVFSFFEIFRGSGGPAVFSVSESGAVLATSFTGSGANLTGIGASALADGAVTSAKIADGTVTGADLASGSVATAQLVDGAVSPVKLSLNSAGLAKVTANAISIAGGAVNYAADQVLYDNDLFLHNDGNHGLGWFGVGKLFGGSSVDGPVLYGWSGGALGSSSGSQKLSLAWNQDLRVAIDPGNVNTGTVTYASLNFGSGNTGEGIVSKRNAGGNQNGLDLFTGYQPRLSINNNGNVGLGRVPAAAGNKLEVEGNASKTAAGSWLANSDARIKTDIQPVSGALDKLAQVRPVQFRYTDEYRAQHPSLADHPYLNVIAQEFQQVFPEYVKTSGEKLADGSEILQVDTYPLVIYSAAAVQELNEQLKAKDAQIAELERRLQRIERLLGASPER